MEQGTTESNDDNSKNSDLAADNKLKGEKKTHEPSKIRTCSLLNWSQTRYRCAMGPLNW